MRTAALVGGGLLFAFLMMGSCLYLIGERPTVVSVNAGPSFAFKGSGQLAIFTVYAPKPGNRIAFPSKDDSSIAWRIAATKGYFEGARVGGMGLTYGKVPDGYIQSVPGDLQTPPPVLPAGSVYSFFAETTDAPIATGYFYMASGGPIQTDVPDLCLTRQDGHNVRVRCGFVGDRTYREPTNLEEAVRKHQIRNTAEAKSFTELEPCEPTPDKAK